MNKLIIAILLLAWLLTLYWNYQQKRELEQSQKNLTTSTSQKNQHVSEIKRLENCIYQTDQEVVKARQDFWKLRLLINEWNVFKGIKEIKELVEQMRNNIVLEEVIK